MRIYAVADIHGRSARIRRVRANILRYKPDAVVLAGDVTSFFHPARILEQIHKLSAPALLIRGNTDLARVERLAGFYSNIYSLHLQRIEIAGVRFAGISGTIPVPFRSRICWRQELVLQKAMAMIDEMSVLVVHPPPYGVLDAVMGKCHAGSRAVARLVRQKNPRLVLCGHIHEASGVAAMGGSWIVNCNMAGGRQGAVVDMEAGKAPAVRMLPENREAVQPS